MAVDVKLTIKNYRCFSDEQPARFSIKDGFTSFVGINNSGKSSILRFFYDFRPVFATLSAMSLKWILQIDNEPFSQVNPSNSLNLDSSEIFCNTNDRDIEIEIQWNPSDYTQQENILVNFDGLLTSASPKQETLHLSPMKLTIQIARSSFNLTCHFFVDNEPIEKPNTNVRKPRGLPTHFYRYKGRLIDISPLQEVCTTFSRMLYIGPFRNLLSIMPEGKYFDILVGRSFIEQWGQWSTGSTSQINEKMYRVMKQIGKIFDLPDLYISASFDRLRIQMLVDGKSYRLDQFGSGLAQFFLVLAQAAMLEPSFILIDEPESNLHPSLQLDFLTTLGSYATQGVLFATHSIGLARSISNLVYSVHKDANYNNKITPYESVPRLAEFLGELSFAGYRELGFDKILLVEGVTDVPVIQQFLRFYGKDHQIVLLPMGGRQMIQTHTEIQLEEIKRITPHIYALIDSERSAPNKMLEDSRAGFVELCKKTDIVCHVLDLRAIENYFPDRVVRKVMGPKYHALQPYEALNKSSLGWSKTDNWRFAREMSRQDIENTDLGKFLAAL